MNNFDLDHGLERRSDKIDEQLLNYCRNGNYKQVVHLFDKFYDNPGFDINCRDIDGNTPLILAAKQGHGTIIQELLRYVPDISCENKKGDTAMYLSPTSIRKILFGSISSVIKCSDRLFCNACWLSNAEVVERFLSKNQVRIGPHLSNIDGVNCFQLVLRNMSSLEQIANSVKSAYKPAQTLQSLLTHSPPSLYDPRLLHVVASKNCKNSVECARVLLRKNFEIGERDEFDFTAIHHASRSGNAGVLELLLGKLGNEENKLRFIDFQGKSGTTALHLASMGGKEDTVKLLLSYGASADIVNSDKHTPAELAKSVRIKNLFSAQSNASKEKLLPEIHFVLSRANTAIPHSPLTRFTPLSGKKSAEPFYRVHREKSLSNPDINDQYDVSTSAAALPPVLSIKSLTMSTELPISHENSSFRQKLTSHSIINILECLDEENQQDFLIDMKSNSGEDEGDENDVFNVTKTNNEFTALSTKKTSLQKQISTPFKGDQVENVSNNEGTEFQSTRIGDIAGGIAYNQKNDELTKNASGILKKRTNNSKNKTASKPVKNLRKSESSNREKSKTVIQGNDKRKVNKKGQNGFVKNQENTNENEVTYESDFNTDSSSAREENQTEQIDNNLIKLEEGEDEDENLNKTIVENLSARITEEQIQWKKGEQLGKGSYGTVWKGMLDNGQYIAVKEIILPDEEENSESCINSTREIRREIEILRTIKHKNIVKYIGACNSETFIHIFMEFVSGGTISNILTKFGGLSEKIIKIYMKQLVTAVAFLHKISIIHRDLKGANIMVTPKGIIKLVDFGCAKKLGNFTSKTASLTQQSRLQGSVYWLAPEVINGAKHTDKSDIWSVGCTGIEMITTKPPWSDLHPFAAMFSIGTGNRPLNISQLTTSSGAKVSFDICLFIESCLTRDVVRRVTAIDLLNSPFLK